MSGSQAVTMLSAKTKAKPKGTSIQGKDAEEIVAGVQAMYEKIPAFIRPMLPALPDILRRIPPSAGKYTLNEIIELLDSAYETGKLKRKETDQSMSHPSKDIISSKGRELAGRKIALLVTSSVASFKAPEIARELMRHGAEVYAVISPSTEKMIGARSEERRVGKECRSRWSPYH